MSNRGDVGFELSGGELCLDFANTIDDRGTAAETDRLASYRELVEWGRQAEAVTVEVASALSGEAERRPRAAGRALVRAKAVREAIYAVFSAVASGRQAPADASTVINDALGDALSALRVSSEGARRYTWTWAGGDDPPRLDRILWPVLWSGARLLTSERLDRVRECAATTCGWLFLDGSKNRSRRWCDMRVCGNRNKARRHYARGRTPPAAH